MQYAYRDWRVVAHYRGLGALQNPREFRKALFLQMTPAELSAYRVRHGGLLITMLTLAALAVYLASPPGLWWILGTLWLIYDLRYTRIDPVTVAMQEYNCDLDAVVQQECAVARERRVEAGL